MSSNRMPTPRAGEQCRARASAAWVRTCFSDIRRRGCFSKNPFELKGIGTEVARRIDDGIESYFPTSGTGRFGVQPALTDEAEAEGTAKRVTEVLRTHAEAPTTGDDLFDDVMEAMDSPAFGPMDHDQYGRPERLEELTEEFEEAESLLEAEFDELVDTDGVGRGFQ